MRKGFTLALTLIALAAPAGFVQAAADTFVVDKVHSEVGFKVRHIFTPVRGRFTDYEGTFQLDKAKPEASSVAFTAKAASIDTANANRDKHLKGDDFFAVEKFPEITFKSTEIKATGKDKYSVTGDLTMRGVTKKVTLAASFLGFGKDPWGNEKAGFEAEVVLNRKDFGINWNKALDEGGFLLGDDVTATIALELNKKKEEPAKK